jgi:hypothetical protein
MQTLVLYKEPIFVDFDRRRRVEINLGTEILIRNAGGKNTPAWEEVGQRVDPETGEKEYALAVNEDNLRLYLWAALQEDAKAHSETLTIEDVRWLGERHNWAQQGVVAVRRALNQYYGGAIQSTPKPTKSKRARAKQTTWEDAFRIVCGEIGLPPSEFYRLLYSELVLILEGHRARYQREMRERREESAWIVSWLLLPHKATDADPITPDELMGRKARTKPAPKFATAAESAQAWFAARAAQSKKKSARLTDAH